MNTLHSDLKLLCLFHLFAGHNSLFDTKGYEVCFKYMVKLILFFRRFGSQQNHEAYCTYLRDEQSNSEIAHKEDPNADSSATDINSDSSGSIFAKSLGSSSSKDLDSTVHQGESGNGVCFLVIWNWLSWFY